MISEGRAKDKVWKNHVMGSRSCLLPPPSVFIWPDRHRKANVGCYHRASHLPEMRELSFTFKLVWRDSRKQTGDGVLGPDCLLLGS